MSEEESEINENDTESNGKIDLISDDTMNPYDDLGADDGDEGLSLSFGGSRGFEE